MNQLCVTAAGCRLFDILTLVQLGASIVSVLAMIGMLWLVFRDMWRMK